MADAPERLWLWPEACPALILGGGGSDPCQWDEPTPDDGGC